MSENTAKTKNKCRNIMLNYGAHVHHYSECGRTQTSGEWGRRQKKGGFRKAAGSGVHRQITVLRGFADLTMLVDRLFESAGRLLVVNGAAGAFQMSFPTAPHKPWQGRSRRLYAMEGEWINGSCSNWSTLCKCAWNSYLLKQHRHSDRAAGGQCALNHWVSQAASTFGDLHLFEGGVGLRAHSLAYKRKPDCVILINPDRRTIEECRGLAIPLCILSVTYPFAAPALSMEGNRESLFLIYLLLHIIGYYNTKSSGR